MRHHRLHRLLTVATASLFVLALGVSAAPAAGDDSPSPAPAPSGGTSATQGKTTVKGATKTPRKKAKKDKRSDAQFEKRYQAARNLVEGGKYKEGLAAFQALKRDDNPSVATYIGFAHRKMGDYDAAKRWYDKALAADPKHIRTMEYYGEWQVERGNLEEAKVFLTRIETICGNRECEEYKDLNEAITDKSH
ncbi:MAG TPA: tetratricopeptide repeat protein [Xanthobacteraceae bacterium]|jgi:tetratricopeptide (TPR) repeat protein|nr:tetratricopeptide repeat protein [Xanthobacteraceae bacterium]